MRDFLSQVSEWEIVVFCVCVLLLGAHFAEKIDFENIFKKDSPVPVHMEGKILHTQTLPAVQVVDIPQTVYDSLTQDTRFKRYLTANHKYVLFFTYPGCPYSSAYTRAFKKMFKELGFDEYYRKRVISVGETTFFSCPSGKYAQNCASFWIFENCFGKLCLLNSQRKQAVIDDSQNPKQLSILLEKYKEW